MALAKVLEFPDTDDTGLMPAFNATIRREMCAQLERETAKCKTEADVQATAIHIVASWAVRSARLYASNILDAYETKTNRRVELLEREVERLRYRCEVLERGEAAGKQ